MQPSEIEEETPEETLETVFVLPETAEILRGFAAEPVWNETLGCFEAHSGTDVAFADGVARSLCGGVVRAINENAVEIGSGEWTLRVVGLEEICVENGSEIKAGDPLGKQKRGAPQEVWLPPHAHIQLLRGGESVDFEDRL